MLQLTLFLAQIFGITFLLAGLTMLLERKMMLEVLRDMVENRALLYVLGILDLIFGLAIVLTHNVWDADMLTTTITAIGWLTLIKGVGRMVIPTATIKRWYSKNNIGKMLPFAGLIMIVVGGYLTYNGFWPMYY
ncbi:MAG: hypothetical protein V4674_03615 [Patescibacteria group bacterium]